MWSTDSDSDSDSDDAGKWIEELRGETNFYNWKWDVTLCLQGMRLWEIVSGKTPRPTVAEPEEDPTSTESASALKAAQRTWGKLDLKARFFLHARVVSGLQVDLRQYRTAAEMWSSLIRRFHRQDAVALQRSLDAICHLRYIDTADNSIKEHLVAFQDHWGVLQGCTEDAESLTGATGSLATVMKVMGESKELKVALLIGTLPMSMGNLVDNLRITHGESLEFSDVFCRLMDLHEIRESHSQQRAREKAAKAQEIDCTWCRSRGLESAGHTWNRCSLLRGFNKEKSRKARTAF